MQSARKVLKRIYFDKKRGLQEAFSHSIAIFHARMKVFMRSSMLCSNKNLIFSMMSTCFFT